jgi:hypothetical protein
MRKLISSLTVILLWSGTLLATDYYVSKQGSDNYPGTRDQPFLTLQKAAEVMHSGDVCYISSRIYAEEVRPAFSGTEGQPLEFRPVGDGEVIITGSDPILREQWQRVSERIFKASIKLDLDHENQIFLDDRTLVEARWPNVGDDLLRPGLSVMEQGTTPELIVDTSLPDYDFSGAQVWIHAPRYWSDWTTQVVAFTDSSLAIENVAPYPGPRQHVATVGADYFVFGVRGALDAENEWYYDRENEEVYIFREDGELPEDEYRVKRRPHAFDLSGKKYIKVEGVTILGAGINTDETTESITLDGLKIFYPYYSSQNNKYYGDQKDKGIVLRGKKIVIQNTEIAYSSGVGVMMRGEDNKLINTYIHDTDFIGSYASCVSLAGKGNVVSHCTLTRSGRTVLDYGDMYQSLIQFCDMSHSGLITSDLGLSYGNVIEGGNSEVRYNVLHHNDDDHLDMGLYYDHGTQNIISHHNIVYGVGYSGLQINHYGAYHLAYHNTFIADKNGFRSSWGNQYGPDLLKCRFVNNLFSGTSQTTATNYYWANNVIGYQGFDEHNIMQPATEWLGQGKYVSGISTTDQPGIGAIEYEGMTFKVGHDFENPPQNIDFTRSQPVYRNRLLNAAFEHENHLSPWQSKNGGVQAVEHPHQNHTKPDTAIGRMGNHTVRLIDESAELYQEVQDLESDTEYEFIGHLRVDQGEQAVIGVRWGDGTEFLSPVVENNAPAWRRVRLGFVLPEEVTTATVFVRRLSGGLGQIYADDFGLVVR